MRPVGDEDFTAGTVEALTGPEWSEGVRGGLQGRHSTLSDDREAGLRG